MKKLGLVIGLLWSASLWAANTADVSWGPVTQYSDGTPATGVTYSVYQGVQGAAKVKVATGLAVLQYSAVSTTLASGTTVCFEVTASAGGQESARSNEACKTFPAATLPAPTAIVVK